MEKKEDDRLMREGIERSKTKIKTSFILVSATTFFLLRELEKQSLISVIWNFYKNIKVMPHTFLFPFSSLQSFYNPHYTFPSFMAPPDFLV